MAIVISTEQIEAAVALYLPANLTISTSIQYPGETLDTVGINDWIEFWIAGFSRGPQRIGNKDQRNGRIVVTCWAKPTSSTYRIMDMSKDVTDAMEHAELTLKNYNDVSEPTTGYMRVFEPNREDLTRKINDKDRTGIRAIRLTFPAYAQEA